MKDYVVQSGDTLVRIAERFGYGDWRDIYHAPENAAFREARPNPDKIFPGDRLILPGREPAPGKFAAGQRHRFRLTRTVDPPPPWEADWDRSAGPATYDCARTMIVTGPDLAAGVAVTFTVTQVGVGEIGKVTATSEPGRATAIWDDWFARARVASKVQLAAGEAFPVIEFRFVAEAAGRRAEPTDALIYADQLEAKLEAPEHVDAGQPASYILYSPYGTRTGTTDANGTLREADLPPGGVSVVLLSSVLEPR